MNKRIYILIIGLLFTFGTQAQILRVTNVFANGITGFPDTIYAGQFYNYTVVVTNFDTATYVNNGTFTINWLADSTFGSFVIYQDTSVFTIAGNDSVSFQVADTFPQNAFKTGNNVVVVWPSLISGTSAFIADTFQLDSVYFVKTTGINDLSINRLSVNPNPFHSFISIANMQPSARELLVYDVSGYLVYKTIPSGQIYDLSFLKPGLYLLEVRYDKYSPARKKLTRL